MVPEYPEGLIVARGKKPANGQDNAKKFAERMGYHWMENPEPDLPFDLLIYKTDSIRAVKIVQTRYRIDPECFYEKKFPEDIRGMRSLPFPPQVFREIWLKTRGERVFRRLHVMEKSVGDIGWWGPDDYTNPHIRQDPPQRKPVPTGKFIVDKIPVNRLYPPVFAPPGGVLENTPDTGSDCQSGQGPENSSGSGDDADGNY